MLTYEGGIKEETEEERNPGYVVEVAADLGPSHGGDGGDSDE